MQRFYTNVRSQYLHPAKSWQPQNHPSGQTEGQAPGTQTHGRPSSTPALCRDNGTLLPEHANPGNHLSISTEVPRAGQGLEASNAHLAMPSVPYRAQLHVCSRHLPFMPPGPEAAAQPAVLEGPALEPPGAAHRPHLPRHMGRPDSWALPRRRGLAEGRCAHSGQAGGGRVAVRCPRRGMSKEVRGPLGSRADRSGRNPVAQCAGAAAQVGCWGSASTAPAQTQGPEEGGDDSSSPFPGRHWPSHRQDAGMCEPHAEQPPVRASPSTPNGHQWQREGQGPLAGPSAPPPHTHSRPPQGTTHLWPPGPAKQLPIPWNPVGSPVPACLPPHGATVHWGRQ